MSVVGRVVRELHIGKSAAGWCFSLHVYPAEDINTLADWQKVWQGKMIRNGSGEEISAAEMLSIITERGREPKWDEPPGAPGYRYSSWDEFHQMNNSQRGPEGLVRRRLGSHCTGHGEGTYDYIVGEFC